jgi:anti-anti-sigma factor
MVQRSGTFAVATEAAADGLVVRLSGEMDLTAADPFCSAVLPWLSGFRAEQVTVDCGSLDFVALAGLDLLLEATSRCRPGGRISLVSPPETLARLLDFTAARSQFTVVDIHDAAGSVAAV